MPRATVSLEGERVDLKSLPGGFVVIRQLSFGQMLKRRDNSLKFYQESTGRQVDAPTRTQIDILNEASRRYDFTNCIVDHNLEDEHGNKLNFANPATIDVLDPRIAAEIEREIDKRNQEDFDEQGFTSQSGQPSMNNGSGGGENADTQ